MPGAGDVSVTILSVNMHSDPLACRSAIGMFLPNLARTLLTPLQTIQYPSMKCCITDKDKGAKKCNIDNDA